MGIKTAAGTRGKRTILELPECLAKESMQSGRARGGVRWGWGGGNTGAVLTKPGVACIPGNRIHQLC